MRAESTIRWLLAIVFISLTGVTLFGATNFYDNPSTKAEIKVDSSVKSASKFVSGSIEKSALFNSLVDKELAIVLAINSMIEDKGIIPTSINELKTNKYLASNFNPENLISSPLKDITFEVKDLVVEINTNIYYSDSSIGTSNDVTIAERDYYLNNPYNDNNNFKIDKKQFIDSSTNTLKSNYYLNRKSLNILGSKTSNNINHSTRYIGNQEPSTYSSVNNSNVWFDSNTKEFDVKQRINNKWSDTTSSNKNLREDGTFVNPKTMPITAVIKNFTNVNITEEEKVIECRTAGATYNQVLNRCEAFTSDACDGNFYDLATDKCYIKPLDYCKANGFDYYDETSNRCFNYVSYGGIMYSYPSYGHTQNAGYSNDAVTYCNNLVESGYSDWYLPNMYSCVLSSSTANISYSTIIRVNSYDPVYGGAYWYSKSNGLYWAYMGYYQDREPLAVICARTRIGKQSGGGGYCGDTTTKEYSPYISNINDYIFINNSINGTDAYVKNPSCNGKKMSVSPYTSTPYYGDNGICYSDVGLYCKTYAGSTSIIQMPNGKQITCYDNSQTCNDARFGLVMNYSGNADKCSKFNYSCNNITRYGLAESPHPQNILPNPYVGANGFDNATVLFDRITDKFNKTLLPANLDKIVAKQDILINDNFGSMCVENIESNYLPTSKDYIIDSKTKSGF